MKCYLAGKQGIRNNSFSQEEVTALIVEYAQQGKDVLRFERRGYCIL
jgi:siroheme synthase